MANHNPCKKLGICTKTMIPSHLLSCETLWPVCNVWMSHVLGTSKHHRSVRLELIILGINSTVFSQNIFLVPEIEVCIELIGICTRPGLNTLHQVKISQKILGIRYRYLCFQLELSCLSSKSNQTQKHYSQPTKGGNYPRIHDR